MDPWAVIAAESRMWACEPYVLESMAAVLAGGADPSLQIFASEFPSALRSDRTSGAGPTNSGAVAVIPIIGPLVNRASPLAKMLGLSSYQAIRQELADASRNRGVSRILLYVDSPGGTVTGVEEATADVRAAARVKPVYAYVAGAALSAAYWIASAADQIVSTPSGQVGSIGVWGLHMDTSKALERAGIKPTFIVSRASPHKVEANPLEPLSRDAKAYGQEQVDTMAAKFIRSVAAGRNTSQANVIRDFGGGRTVMAESALARGMIDGMDSELSRIAAGAPPQHKSITALRAELDILEHG